MSLTEAASLSQLEAVLLDVASLGQLEATALSLEEALPFCLSNGEGASSLAIFVCLSEIRGRASKLSVSLALRLLGRTRVLSKEERERERAQHL